MERVDAIEFTREDVEGVSRLLGAWLASQRQEQQLVAEQIVVKRIEIDLGAIISGVAGIQDPLGQLRQFLANVLNTAAAQIIAAIQGAIQSLCGGLADALFQIGQSVANVANFVKSALETLKQVISQVVVQPLLEALSWIQDVLPQLMDAANQFVSMVVSAATEVYNILRGILDTVIDRLQGVVDWLRFTVLEVGQLLYERLTSVIDAVTRALQTAIDTIQRIPQAVADVIEMIVANAERLIGTIVETIRSAIGGVVGFVQTVVDTIRSALSTLASMVTSAVQQVVSTLQTIAATVYNTVRGIVDTVVNALSTLPRVVSEAIDVIRRMVESAIGFVQQIPSMILNVLQQAVSMAQNVLATLTRTVQGFVNTVTYVFGEAVNTVSRFVQTITDVIGRAVATVQEVLGRVESFIAGFVERVASTLASLPDVIMRALQAAQDAVSTFVRLLQDAVGRAASYVSGVVDTVARLVQNVVNVIQQIPNAVSNAISTITSMITSAVDTIRRVFEQAQRTVQTVIDALAALPRLARQALDYIAQIVRLLSDIPSVIRDAIEAVRDFVLNLPSYAAQAVENVSTWIWEHLPDWVRRFLEEAPKALDRIGVALTGFINAILKFPEWFPNWFQQYIAKPISDAINTLASMIWESMPDWLKNALQSVSDFLTSIADSLKNALSKLAEYITNPEKLYADIWSALRWLGEQVWGALQWAWGKIVEVGKWLAGALSDAASAIMEAAKGAIAALMEVIGRAVKWLYETLIEKPLAAITDAISKIVSEAFGKALGARGERGEAFILWYVPMRMMPYLTALMLPPYLIEGSDELIKEIEASIEPLGVGAKIKMRILGVIRKIAEMFKDVSHEVLRGFMIGMGFNVLDPFKYVTRPAAKALLDPVFNATLGIEAFFELPSETMVKEIIRRRLASGEEESKLLDIVAKIFEVRGLPREFYAYVVAPSQQWFLNVTDRWGLERKWPLSPIYEYPTVSELATFMIKDMFGKPEDFIKAMMARGVPRDIALFFYLNHFKYPSVEKLADFFWRGIAGELWNPDKSIDEAAVQVFGLENVQEWVVAPRELNFNVAQLYHIITSYLKWQDYARFPWKKGFPTDNAIVTDLLADVPGKIDLRWMTRWGIFDVWGMFGKTVESTIEDITLDLIGGGKLERPYDFAEKLRQPVIEMDIRQFCRTLQAVGLHPYWVPWVAIAETINTLTDERTLLRTGFINMFKEGFWDKTMLDRLLGGFFTIKFRVAYLDMSQGLENARWVERDVMYPVAYLPAEARLLELRAAMDRALDILRDFVKTLNRAFYEYVVERIEDYLALLKEAIKRVNEWFKPMVRALTGKELEVIPDEAYWSAYAKVLQLYRGIYTLHRVRYWIGRILGWLVYRLAYGYVKREDIEKIVDMMAEKARMVEEERDVIKQIMVTVAGIARREYIPTPPQLATIAEVVPEAKKLADQVFEARGVPEEWRPIWKKYIEIKPVVDELRRFVTTIITYYAKGVVTPEEFTEYLNMLRNYGWTDFEISVIKRIAEIRRKYELLKEEAKEYIPTPAMLATIAEVVPEAVKFADKVFEARRVPPEWRPLWLKYITTKPIVDEVRRLLTAYARALRYGIELGELEKTILDVAYNAGWTSREIEIIKLRAHVEELIDEARELRRQYLPTPFSLATLAEYVEVPIELVKSALEARRVPKEWMDLWLRYIQVRPLADEARMLATAFFKAKRYGVPLGELEQRVIEILKKLGFSERELQLRMLRATIEAMIDEWREAQRQYIPTPSMLASIAEVVPEARRLLPMVLEARRVPREWVEIWTKYVQIKPLIDEVKSLLSAVRRLYEYFAIRPEEFRRWLQMLRSWGFEERELQLIMARSEVERSLRAWREIAGDVDKMIRLAEYSPRARRVALALVERMIDALPTDENTKEFLKAMWREYVRVRPVYDEVRRYVTELINDYARGVITRHELEQELNALREWGLDDYEIQFYLWLAERRRARYARRSHRG